MYKTQRHQEIINLLKNNGYMTVEELCSTLYVSAPTIRRDLTELERKQFISRSHGGAMIKTEHNAEVPIDFRFSYHTKAKSVIARAAATLINDGDVVFIDASTTAQHILEFIKEKNDLTVITNSIQAALYLRGSGITVYSIGGKMLDNSLAYGGNIAEEILERFNIDILFFSAYGILTNGKIQDYSEAETSLRIKALKNAKTSVFLCDKSKLGKKSLFNVADITEVDYLVTDAILPDEFLFPKEKIIFTN